MPRILESSDLSGLFAQQFAKLLFVFGINCFLSAEYRFVRYSIFIGEFEELIVCSGQVVGNESCGSCGFLNLIFGTAGIRRKWSLIGIQHEAATANKRFTEVRGIVDD